MRLAFRPEPAAPSRGARYRKIGIFLDGTCLGYIESLDETYVIHMPTGGEVGPYHSLGEAKKAVQAGLRAGVLGRRKRA
ncbi:MAG: hypothetical protein SCH98_09910 [Deferrisomatales bacterium]|nr:hypothetical protein [Deferrisomatales bacterium]